MLKTLFDIDRIKYGTDEGTFTRAVALYEKGKVTQIECAAWCFSAVVLGTEPYRGHNICPKFHERALYLLCGTERNCL